MVCVRFQSQLRDAGSFVVAHRLSSCASGAYLLHNMRDLSSLTRGSIYIPCILRQILNHWTTREVPTLIFLLLQLQIADYGISHCYNHVGGFLNTSPLLQTLCPTGSVSLENLDWYTLIKFQESAPGGTFPTPRSLPHRQSPAPPGSPSTRTHTKTFKNEQTHMLKLIHTLSLYFYMISYTFFALLINSFLS